MVWITDSLEIPDDELTFTASRSSGAGGQNVNKVNTRVTLTFDLAASSSLTAAEKDRIAERLATRVNKTGVLRVTSQRHRTQAANRDAAVARFTELLRSALLRGADAPTDSHPEVGARAPPERQATSGGAKAGACPTGRGRRVASSAPSGGYAFARVGRTR